MMASMVALAAFTAAVVSVGLVFDQATKLIEETSGTMSDEYLTALARIERAQKQLADGYIYEAEKMLELAQGHHKLTDQMIADMNRQITATKQAMDPVVVELLEKIRAEREAAGAGAPPAIVTGLVGPTDVDISDIEEAFKAGRINVAIEDWIQAFRAASKSGNAASLEQVAMMLVQLDSWDELRAGIINSSTEIVGSLEAMRDAVVNKSGDFKNSLQDAIAELGKVKLLEKKKAKDEETKPPSINFNNTKITIQQDFRNQDPDRVAVVFQRDLARAAVRRIQSGRAVPFGV